MAGAWDGVNLDGGGSTCMAIMDSTGRPVQLNKDTASAAYDRERTVGAHFGVYAKALPGLFGDVIVQPDDTAATLTWTTTSPATSQVRFGLTTDLEMTTALNAGLTTNHAMLLTNLTPGAEYYYALYASAGHWPRRALGRYTGTGREQPLHHDDREQLAVLPPPQIGTL